MQMKIPPYILSKVVFNFLLGGVSLFWTLTCWSYDDAFWSVKPSQQPGRLLFNYTVVNPTTMDFSISEDKLGYGCDRDYGCSITMLLFINGMAQGAYDTRLSGNKVMDTLKTPLTLKYEKPINEGDWIDGSKICAKLIFRFHPATNIGELDSCNGTLPPVLPPSPLACSLMVLSNIDWGVVSLSEVNETNLAEGQVIIRCSGGSGGSAIARITLTDVGSGGEITKIQNSNGDFIPVKLSLDDKGNSKDFTVYDGFSTMLSIYARFQMHAISTYGEFRGAALLKINII